MSLPPLLKLTAATLLAIASCAAHAQLTTGAMTEPRMFHRASPLPDGRIMLTGGASRPGNPIYASTEVYDPATGQFTPGVPMLAPRRDHAAVTLQDGRILVAGGMALDGAYTDTAEIFDPASGQWSSAGTMNAVRSTPVGLRLQDGRVMILDNRGGGPDADVFDPATGLFTRTGPMIETAFDAGLAALPDGRVLKVGGLDSSGYSREAELWDPATNQWSATAQMNVARNITQPVVLADGRVLVAGGRMANASTEIYDPASGMFTPASTMPMDFEPRSAELLSNGDVLLTADWTRQLMHYQAATGTWNLTGPQRTNARDSAVSLLPNGKVLITGGAELDDATSYAAVWEPSCAGQMIEVMNPDQTVSGDGGTASFTLTAAPGCRFEAADVPSWLTVNGGSLQQMPEGGMVDVVLTATPNQSGASRSASFLLGNTAVTMTQAAPGGCPSAPVVSPNPIALARTGASGTLSVQAAASCSWSVASMPSFVSVTGATSGTGNGSIAFTAAANPDAAPRSGSGQLAAMGQSATFMFTQDGQPCPTAPVISLSSNSFTAAGGTANGTVTAAATCTWSVAAPGWASITAGASGTGNGSFTLAVPVNTGAARSGTGTLTAPGVTASFNISQAAAAACSTPIASGVPVNGNLQPSACPAGSRGAGYNTDRYTFNSAPGHLVTISLTSSVFDTYLYLRDPTGKLIKSDDDSGGGTNSRISFKLPAGTAGSYTIEATSYAASKTGAYVLSLNQ